jgi:hypothetical protein
VIVRFSMRSGHALDAAPCRKVPIAQSGECSLSDLVKELRNEIRRNGCNDIPI